MRRHPWTNPQFSQIHTDWEVPFLGLQTLPVVIGLTGPTKCGKTVVAKHLVTEFGFRYESLSYLLKEMTVRLGRNQVDGYELKQVATEIRKLHGNNILAVMMLRKIRRTLVGNESFVIDSILHTDEINIFQNLGQNFILLGFDADIETRANAAARWYGGDVSEWVKRIEERDKEEQYGSKTNNPNDLNIDECLSMAKKLGRVFQVEGELSKKTLYDQIDNYIKDRISKVLLE